MKQALDAKQQSSKQSTPHGKAPSEGKTHEHPDREGGNREFRRRKSG